MGFIGFGGFWKVFGGFEGFGGFGGFWRMFGGFGRFWRVWRVWRVLEGVWRVLEGLEGFGAFGVFAGWQTVPLKAHRKLCCGLGPGVPVGEVALALGCLLGKVFGGFWRVFGGFGGFWRVCQSGDRGSYHWAQLLCLEFSWYPIRSLECGGRSRPLLLLVYFRTTCWVAF